MLHISVAIIIHQPFKKLQIVTHTWKYAEVAGTVFAI